MSKPNVAYVMLDKLGGIASMNRNLIRFQPDGLNRMPQHVVLIQTLDDLATRTTGPTGADSDSFVQCRLLTENRYTILNRLARVIPRGTGALVSNDWYDLALCHIRDPGRAVFQIVHDEYNLDLAKQFGSVVDVFIAHSRYFFDRLRSEIPGGCERAVHLSYGVPLTQAVRSAKTGPLRLIFIGRMVEMKGIFDIPIIDSLLADLGILVDWTLVGDGPDKARLQREWLPRAPVKFLTPVTNTEVLDICSHNDIFVFPTRFEGFPVALLEAMSVGLVPVVSDLPSGVPEVVTEQTGFRVPVGDVNGFVSAIVYMYHNPELLERMSGAARKVVQQRFNIQDRASDYHKLFENWQELRRPRPTSYPLRKFGSRLDQPWLPNWFVKTLRRQGLGSVFW
jgi:glycosyltransferase involved in cell wall biosynthesis